LSLDISAEYLKWIARLQNEVLLTDSWM